MKYYMGIDGGGTKTRVCIIDETMQKVAYGSSGPSSIDTVDLNVGINNIMSAMGEAAMNLKDNDYLIYGIFAGLGGMVTDHHNRLIESQLRKLPRLSDDCQIIAKNDMENAYLSGDFTDRGIALIIGTGMVSFGRNQKGETHKAAGWGFKEGEAGSAYDLGRQAIKKAIRSFDGRLKPSAFTKEVLETLEIAYPIDIIMKMDELWGKRTKVANLAKLVTKHADLDDLYAKDICIQATKEIALTVYAVAKKLKLEKSKLVIIGSLGNSKGFFKTQLHDEIKALMPELEIIKKPLDPAFAAAKYIKERVSNVE